jgi:vacuolar-type H+-ATPase subunit H
MDLFQEIDALIAEIEAAKPVPFSASAMINKQELLERLDRIKDTSPEELKQARWMMRDREELLERTRKEAEQVVSDARVERDRLVAKTEIVSAANREADKIIDDAKSRAREIRMEAEDYVDAKLANFEVVLQKTLAAVAKGRESLRGRLDLQAQELQAAEEALTDQGPDGPQRRPDRAPETKAEPSGNVKIRRP